MTLRTGRGRSRRGATLVEFAFVGLLLFVVMLAIIEFSRMLLVYTTVANASRIGARYAVVHGFGRTGAGIDGPSAPGNTTQVENVVKLFAGVGLLRTAALTVNVNYPDPYDPPNRPGAPVVVTVSYRYDPWMALPLGANLSSTSAGIITCCRMY